MSTNHDFKIMRPMYGTVSATAVFRLSLANSRSTAHLKPEATKPVLAQPWWALSPLKAETKQLEVPRLVEDSKVEVPRLVRDSKAVALK